MSEEPYGSVNYPSNFQVEGGANLYIFGDYLYWIPQSDGLYYAHTGFGAGTATIPPDGSFDFKGTLKKIHPHFDNGVRAGVGCNFPKEGYEVSIYWTWFATGASDSVKGSLFSIWGHPDAVSADTFAKGDWHMDLDLADLEWGRASWFGGKFSLRPFFSIRGLWLDQELKNRYHYATTPAAVGDLHSKSDYRGGGLRAGADARFALPCGFSIYGLASGSLLYGFFNTDFSVKEDHSIIAKTKEPRFWNSVSSLQLALLFGWDTHFDNERFHFELHAGWEQNTWFGVNQMNHYLQKLGAGFYYKENSDLTLQGLVAGGRFDF